MTTFRRNFLLVLSSLVIHASCSHQIDPPAPTISTLTVGQRYKHDLFGSEAECRRRNPNYEMSCSELILLNPDGQVDILLGGGDILVRSSYIQTPTTITVKTASGLPKDIIFTIISKTELVRMDNNTRWQSY